MLRIIYFAVLVLMIIALWNLFIKAGRPGWASIIPFYNLYVLLIIAGKPGWWLILMFIPLVNIVIGVIVNLALAEKFGKSPGFAIGLLLLPVIFFPILAFGSAKYSTG
ncbi:MAG: DUF5684 domain-containing protein [Planctomycetota bacterium]